MHRVIDFQDDLGAAFLAADAEAGAALAHLKEASVPEAYEMCDRDFALLLVDDASRTHRKFACHDAGNTWMSLWYLENVSSGLPEKATKVAAAVLYQAAQDFGLTDELLTSMFPKTATQAAKMGQKIEQGKLASAESDPRLVGLFGAVQGAVGEGVTARAGRRGRAAALGALGGTAGALFGHAVDPAGWTAPLVGASVGARLAAREPAEKEAHMLDRRVRVKDTDLAPIRSPGHRKEADFDKVAQAMSGWSVLDPYGRRVKALELEQGKLASAPVRVPVDLGTLPAHVRAAVLKHDPDGPHDHVSVEEAIRYAANVGDLGPGELMEHAKRLRAMAPADGKIANAPAHMLDRRVRVRDTDLAPLQATAHRKEASGALGAVLGGAAGAGIGAATARKDRGESRLRRALFGGAVGAAGGYSLGANIADLRAEADALSGIGRQPLPTEAEVGAGLRRAGFRQGKTASAPAHMLDRRVHVKDTELAPLRVAGHHKEADFDKVAQAVNEWGGLSPYDRRVTALELEKVSSVVDTPEEIKAYMGHEVGPYLKVAMDARAERIAKTAESADDYRRVAAMAKLGSIDTESAVEAIHLLDQANGIRIPDGYGPRIPDPYKCVYGLHKQAMWSWTRGAEYVNEHDLGLFAASPASKHTLGQLFEDSLVEKFRRDPVKTFESMPREQQHIVARAATQSGYRDTGGLGT